MTSPSVGCAISSGRWRSLLRPSASVPGRCAANRLARHYDPCELTVILPRQIVNNRSLVVCPRAQVPIPLPAPAGLGTLPPFDHPWELALALGAMGRKLWHLQLDACLGPGGSLQATTDEVPAPSIPCAHVRLHFERLLSSSAPQVIATVSLVLRQPNALPLRSASCPPHCLASALFLR